MIRQDILGFMQHTNKEELIQKVKNKQVYIWGSFIQGKYIKDYLEELGINISGFIDNYRGEYMKTSMYML